MFHAIAISAGWVLRCCGIIRRRGPKTSPSCWMTISHLLYNQAVPACPIFSLRQMGGPKRAAVRKNRRGQKIRHTRLSIQLQNAIAYPLFFGKKERLCLHTAYGQTVRLPFSAPTGKYYFINMNRKNHNAYYSEKIRTCQQKKPFFLWERKGKQWKMGGKEAFCLLCLA